ncbi:MAG: hypothetical protein WA973_12890 [Mesorhizobium sp.]
MKLWKWAALGAVVALSGCAKNPEAIVPMSMPANAYSGLSCAQLDAEFRKSAGELHGVEVQQRQAVTGDAVGVFLIGVPMSSLTGADKEGAVAQRKGEVIAIQSAQRSKGCSVSQIPAPAAKPKAKNYP